MNEPEPMRDHWWWRPGWSVGRSFYTWHVTFADQSGAQQLVNDYAPVLATLPQLDPVPARGLHLTLQGIVEAARKRCAELEPFTVTIGPAHVDPDTIQMPA